MKKFIILPNKLVWNYEDNEDTYLVKYGDKILHIFSYLARRSTMFGECFFTIENLIIDCGLTPKTGVGKVNNNFREILVHLQSNGIIVTDTDIKTVGTSRYICSKFNMPIAKDRKNNTQFFPIDYNSYLKIMNYEGNLNKLLLLKVFYYINARISRRESSPVTEYCGGKASTFYDNYNSICDDLKIAVETWNSYIKELQSLDLVHFDNIGLVRKSGSSQTSNNVYCIDKAELHEALKQSKLYYKTNGFTVQGVKVSTESRSISGMKGKIKQLKNDGQDTSQLERKLIKLEKQIKPNKSVELVLD
jgi:hypothetical protein